MAATRPRVTTRAQRGSAARSRADGVHEFGGRLGMREGVGARLGDDEDVFRGQELGTRVAEYLPDQPLQTVSDDRVPDPAAHGDTEAGRRACRRLRDDDEMRAMPAT